MQLFVNDTFLFRGAVRRAGTVLIVSESDLASEMGLGKHPVMKEKWVSGLLNHCSPADDATAKFLNVDEVAEPEEMAKKEAVKKVDASDDPRSKTWAKFDALGAAYDKRWNQEKLENELVKAKKLKGV